MENFINFQKVIWIDNDCILNLIQKKMLDIIGFKGTVLEFNNGQEALEFVIKEFERLKTKSDNNLIVLDLEMPIMNGWEFLERFQKLDPKIIDLFKIIVSSSSSDPEDIKRALSFEFVDEYIPKPITIEVFKRIIWG